VCIHSKSGSGGRFGNIASSFPGKFNFVTINISTLGLSVSALYGVSVGELPLAGTLGFIEVEVAFEVGAVGVTPLSLDELTRLKGANVLLASLVKDVGTLTVFLSLDPVARVDVLAGVSHNALAVTLSINPVAVVLADTFVSLDTDSVLLVIFPVAFVVVGLGVLSNSARISVSAGTVTNLHPIHKS